MNVIFTQKPTIYVSDHASNSYGIRFGHSDDKDTFQLKAGGPKLDLADIYNLAGEGQLSPDDIRLLKTQMERLLTEHNVRELRETEQSSSNAGIVSGILGGVTGLFIMDPISNPAGALLGIVVGMVLGYVPFLGLEVFKKMSKQSFTRQILLQYQQNPEELFANLSALAEKSRREKAKTVIASLAAPQTKEPSEPRSSSSSEQTE